MKKINDADVRWLVNATFGRHKSPERFAKTLPLPDMIKALLIVWEAGRVSKGAA